MYVDASAIVAVILDEEDADRLVRGMAEARDRTSSIVSAFEAVVAVGRKTGNRAAAVKVVREFLDLAEIAITDAGDGLPEELSDAHERYGNGSGHPAQLNMGDCFSYAMAKTAGVPLLYNGGEFADADLA